MKTFFILLLFLIPPVFKGYCQTAQEYYESGLTKFNLNDYTGAVADCNKAIEINPKYELAFFLRGKIKTIIHDYKYAINNLTKAIEINPQHAEAYYYRGIAKCEIGQKESGCLDINKAVELGFQTGYEAIKKYCTNISDAKPVTSNEPIGIKAFLKKAAEKSGRTYDDAKADNLIKAFGGDNEKIVRAIGEREGYTGDQLNYFRDHVFQKYGIKQAAQEPQTPYIPETSTNVPIQTPKINLGKLQSPVSVEEFAKRIKEKYPYYKDVDDSTLVSKVIEKYPYYKDKINLSKTSSSTTDQTKSSKPEQPAQPASTEQQYNSNEHKLSNQTVKTETSTSHFQNDKIKVGNNLVELPIPSGFVKVDDSMGLLMKIAKDACPKENTLLAYYISDGDYASFLVNQYHPIEKYFLIEVNNEIKYTALNLKQHKQLLKDFKDKYIEDYKKLFDKVGYKTTEILSNLNIELNGFDHQPLGICYESQMSISQSLLVKCNFKIDDGTSYSYLIVGVYTLTRVKKNTLFLYSYKVYNNKDDINSICELNKAWIKEIEKREDPIHFFAEFDYEKYIEIIIAILSLSFIWAIYFTTKKIFKKIKTRTTPEIGKDDNVEVETNSDKNESKIEIDNIVVEGNVPEVEYIDFRSYIDQQPAEQNNVELNEPFNAISSGNSAKSVSKLQTKTKFLNPVYKRLLADSRKGIIIFCVVHFIIEVAFGIKNPILPVLVNYLLSDWYIRTELKKGTKYKRQLLHGIVISLIVFAIRWIIGVVWAIFKESIGI